MIVRPRPAAIPEELAFFWHDRVLVDAGVAVVHQAVFVELPVLIAVGAVPLARVVMVFVGKAHADAVAVMGPQFLDQAVIQFARPLAFQQGDNGGAALRELAAFAPPAVFRIGEGDLFRVAGIPAVFGQADFFDGAFAGEGWYRWSD